MHWEYRTIKLAATGFWAGGIVDALKLDEMMDDLGRDGWELSAAFDTNQRYGATRDVAVIFKRQSKFWYWRSSRCVWRLAARLVRGFGPRSATQCNDQRAYSKYDSTPKRSSVAA